MKILRGTYKGKEGKVTEVYRKKWVIHVEGINRDKINGSSAKVGIDASKVEIIELKLSKDRKAILDRDRKSRASGEKYTEKEVANLD